MSITAAQIWLLAGIIFILIEFSTIPGIGFLFVGFGALSNAILIYNYPFLVHYQLTGVWVLSILWFLILWWPLKFYMRDKKSKQRSYFDITGSEVKVFNNIMTPGSIGLVELSGTIMNAKLEEHEKQKAQIGQILYITKVQGDILICSKTRYDADSWGVN